MTGACCDDRTRGTVGKASTLGTQLTMDRGHAWTSGVRLIIVLFTIEVVVILPDGTGMMYRTLSQPDDMIRRYRHQLW